MNAMPPIHITSSGETAERAAKARGAQILWRRYHLTERVRCLRGIWAEIVNAKGRLFKAMHEDSGAPLTDIEASDFNGLEMVVKYFTRHAHRILKDRAVPRPWIFLNKRAYIRSIPYGVVGIASSRSLPMLAPLADAFTALIAGNAALVKPAQWSTRTFLFIEDVIRSSAILPEDLLQVLPGDDSTGLGVLKECDMLAFTGPAAVGREMARLCSERLKPALLELGGKHAMIVLRDAPFERAVQAAVWGAFSHCGQGPVNVQHVFVESDLYPAFSEALTRALGGLRQRLEYSYESDLGRLISPEQMEVFAEHLNDARGLGARVIGGEIKDRDRLLASPALVLDAPPDAKVMREETPGPVLAVASARSGEEAIRLVNKSPYGLAASIWSLDLARAEFWSSYIEAGLISLNDLTQHDSICSLPYGGFKDSGMGRRHGDDGLRIFCQQQSVLIHEWPSRLPEWRWFPYSRLKSRALSVFTRFM